MKKNLFSNYNKENFVKQSYVSQADKNQFNEIKSNKKAYFCDLSQHVIRSDF